jgi:hypothetical protein
MSKSAPFRATPPALFTQIVQVLGLLAKAIGRRGVQFLPGNTFSEDAAPLSQLSGWTWLQRFLVPFILPDQNCGAIKRQPVGGRGRQSPALIFSMIKFEAKHAHRATLPQSG